MKRFKDSEIEELRKGINAPLKRLYDSCQVNCLKKVMSIMNCQKVDAEDALMDSLLVIRDKIMTREFVNDNIPAYWVTVANNRLRNQFKRDRKLLKYDVTRLESVLHEKNAVNEDDDSSDRLQLIFSSLEKLSSQCKDLLTANLVEGIPLKNLVHLMGYSSYDVVKTSKSRCMKKLRAIINESSPTDG